MLLLLNIEEFEKVLKNVDKNTKKEVFKHQERELNEEVSCFDE
jgi:hypothetical protein